MSRDVARLPDLFVISEDGSGRESLPDNEIFMGTASVGRVIFARATGGQSDVFAIDEDGCGAEIPLAATADSETLGGIF